MDRPMRKTLFYGLAAASALGAPAARAGAQQGAQPVTASVTMRMPSSDTMVARIYNAPLPEVRTLVKTWRDKEQFIIGQLVALRDDDFPQRRRLEGELNLHVRLGMNMMSALESRCIDGGRGALPSGYLGLNTQTSGEILPNGEKRGWVTIIESTVPGSPADRAGLKAFDKLLSIAGIGPDRMGDIGLQMVPDRTLEVRVERDGAPQTFTVTVGRRPDGFGSACGELQETLMPMRIPGPNMMRIRARTDTGEQVIIEEVRPRSGTPPTPLLWNVRPGMRMTVGYFAGAEFRELTPDWQERLGIREGVLVSEVADGSAAAAGGLKGGDVVTRFANEPVKDPFELVRKVSASQGEDVTLTVARGRERKNVVIKLGRRIAPSPP